MPAERNPAGAIGDALSHGQRASRTSATLPSFETLDDPPPEALAAVDAGLEAHNRVTAALADVRPLAAFARQPSGQIVGGAVGRTWGACCELLQLWVHPDHRRVGIASRLLTEFESRAATRGCHVFYLTTLSFQAPAFYRKRGYTVLAEIAGYPDNIVKYLMHKRGAGAAAARSERS